MKTFNPPAEIPESLSINERAAVPPAPLASTSSRPFLPRRSFLRRLALGAVAAAPGAGLLTAASKSFAAPTPSSGLSQGDTAILQFLAAAEIIETDLWQQYNELGGQDSAESGYRAGLEILDEDQPQYISDNTDDEMSHVAFLNAYLRSKGKQGVNFDQFRTLPSSQASGAQQIGRLTNLTQLTIDTSWWTRYRSKTNPDLGATFPNAVPSLATGLHTAIPRNDSELGDPDNPSDHVKAIAFTAGFHFGFIEQGGTSLYAAMALKASNLEVLRIILSIGGSEMMHFQTWQDKAGNATPLTDHDPINNSDVDLRRPDDGATGDFAGEPDHAGAVRLHQQESAEMLDHPADRRSAGQCHGSGERVHGGWPLSRAITEVPESAQESGGRG